MLPWETFALTVLVVLVTAAIGGWCGAALHLWWKGRTKR